MNPTRADRGLPGRSIVVALAIVAAVTASCSSDDAADPTSTTTTPATTWPTIEEAPRLPAREVESEPLWSVEDLGLTDAGQVALVADLAVVIGTDQPGTTETTIAVADAASGELRWQLTALSPLADGSGDLWPPDDQVRPPISDGAVVVVTVRGSGSGWGIAALDLSDGSVRWHHELPATEADQPPQIVGADDEGVAVGALLTAPDDEPDADPVWSTVLLGSDGTPVWEAYGVAPRLLTADLVVTEGTSDDGDAQVFGIERSDGAQRWTTASEARPRRGDSGLVDPHLGRRRGGLHRARRQHRHHRR